MSKNNSIGVFDSGIGGATVLKEIIKILPNENIIYYSDSKNNPYGDKTEDEVFELSDKTVNMFMQKKCKTIVIACNTASAKAAKRLRDKYPEMLIMAIEPAYKMVYDLAYEYPTLIMATKGTIESEKFHNLYEKYDNHQTYIDTCIGLADIIEVGNKEQIQTYLKNNLSNYEGKVKNVVLGCTHYPLIKDQIRQVLGDVNFFDGAPRLAENLKNVLEKNDLLNNQSEKGCIEFIDSSNSEYKRERFYKYISI